MSATGKQENVVPKADRWVALGRVRFLAGARVYSVRGNKRVHIVIVDCGHVGCMTCGDGGCDHADAVIASRRPRQRRRARSLRLL